MARAVGDLWPQSSGSAALGAEITNHAPIREVRPFASVHSMSGVFYDPILGQSGVVRYNLADDRSAGFPGGTPSSFEFSIDGGRTFPMRIGAYKRGTSSTIQAAAISTPINTDMYVDASGTLFLIGRRGVTVFAESATASVDIISNSTANIFANGNVSLSSNFDIDLAGQSVDVVSTLGVINVQTSLSDITLEAGIAGFDLGGQISLSPFGASGVMEYRFGPHQSWYIKTSHGNTGGPFNDGYWPIAHSGNINQLINQVGLQQAYNVGNTVNITTPRSVEWIANTATSKFSTNGSQPELNISGVFQPPTSPTAIGDLFMMNHNILDVGVVSDLAAASAKSLGPADMVLQTGSGTVALSTCSGVAQFLTLSEMDITTAEQTVPFSDINYQASDKNYACGTEAVGTSGRITIFSPGLYKVDFKVQATKTVGGTPQTCRYRALLNGSALLGGVCNSFHFDNTSAATNSGALSVIFNANAGDIFTVGVLSPLSGADNCRLVTRAGLLVIQKLGPKRGVF